MLAKIFQWDEDKNNLLREGRNISFEDVVFALKNEILLDIISSPTHEKQRCFVVNVNEYAYIVPFVEGKECYFLKTIYPSRKHTKFYFKD